MLIFPSSYPADMDAVTADRLARLQADPDILFAEPDHPGYLVDLPAARPAPNDPEYARQTWLEAVGARQAWASATGKDITVAIIDSGVDLSHPDLAANLRGDGFSTGDNSAHPQDRIGHGTFVAGIVAARRNNAHAGSGLAPEARILPIKITPGSEKSFSSAALAQAEDYAVERSAHIINMSLVAAARTDAVAAAIDRALAAGIVVVAAAGNSAGEVGFPANHPGVIAAAGATAAGALMTSSNFGPSIAVAAPGIGITSTLLGGGFGENGFGTSHAAPAVANLLQMDSRPSPSVAADIIKITARPLTSSTEKIGFGHIDAGKSVQALMPDLPLQTTHSGTTLDVNYVLPRTGGPVDVHVSVKTTTRWFWPECKASPPPSSVSSTLPTPTPPGRPSANWPRPSPGRRSSSASTG